MFCVSLWGNLPHAFSFHPSIGTSGGLLIIWDVPEVEVLSLVSFEHVLMIHEKFVQLNEEFYLVNVYVPCDASAKQLLGDSLGFI